MAKTVHIVWDAERSLAANASRHLPALAAAYFAEARTLLAEAAEPAHLHRLRLISKRLRYTLELFRQCYGPGLEQRIQSLRSLQDLLGETNDAVASAQLIRKSRGSVRMRQYLERRAAQKASEFRTEWRTHFDAPGREAWWVGYLHRAGRRTAKQASANAAPDGVSSGSARRSSVHRTPCSDAALGNAGDAASTGEEPRLGAPFDPQLREIAASDPANPANPIG